MIEIEILLPSVDKKSPFFFLQMDSLDVDKLLQL